MENKTSLSLLKGNLWLIAGIIGAATFAIIWLMLPHERTISSVWEISLKFFAFLCITAAIAFMPNKGKAWYLVLFVAFLAFTGYIIPRISYYFYFYNPDNGEDFYTHLYLLMYPGAVLAVTAAYRIGGGLPGRAIKIAFTGILIVFSGYLDVMWQLVNPLGEIAKTLDAPHIVMITGRPVTYVEAIIFTIAHIPFIVGLNLLPLDRWINKLFGAEGPAA